MDRLFIGIGAICAFLGVALGAFGAHGLRGRVEPRLFDAFVTGTHYHLFHAIGLFAVAFVISRWPSPTAHAAGWFMLAGIVLFSGSLYLLALTGTRWLGAITPLGGTAFLIAWGCLAAAAFRG